MLSLVLFQKCGWWLGLVVVVHETFLVLVGCCCWCSCNIFGAGWVLLLVFLQHFWCWLGVVAGALASFLMTVGC